MTPDIADTADMNCKEPEEGFAGGKFTQAFISPSKNLGELNEPADILGFRYLDQLKVDFGVIPNMESKHRRFIESESWEGIVIKKDKEGFIAKLSRRYKDFPAEEAFIPWLEINDADRETAVEGSAFNWKVGYLESKGTRFSVSHIQFRRIPNLSEKQQVRAENRAAEYASLFDE